MSEDDILRLCGQTEMTARKRKDYNTVFRVGLIFVNSSCLKGDIGLGINKAQEMYEEAKSLKSELGMALSIQAVGTTYMHSDQYLQAETTFAEAEKYMKSVADLDPQIRLAIQQLYVSVSLKKLVEAQSYIEIIRQLLEKTTDNQDAYALYVKYYEVLCGIETKDEKNVNLLLSDFSQIHDIKNMFPSWYYNMYLNYYLLTENHESALLYCDSLLKVIHGTKNINEYKNELKNKATLLRAINKNEDACVLYEEINRLSDSLNMESYVRQVDSLRTTYWIDQMELSNVESYNEFLLQILISALIVLFISATTIWIVRNRNRKLIDSKKKLEITRKEAADSIQSKSLFLSNMSHELRTPLNAIVGFSEILSSEDEIDSELKQQCADIIKQNSDLLLKLLNDVIDVSALQGNSMKFTFHNVDVVLLCQNVLETVDRVKRSSARLCFSTALPRLELSTDPGRLQQVLINLLINATKFTSEGSIKLLLDVDSDRNEVVFTVEDTGCGIPLERQPYIFERFEKLHEGVQGAGLGLSICQLIVERIGGRIWIDSSYTQGARFVFTQPLSYETKNIIE